MSYNDNFLSKITSSGSRNAPVWWSYESPDDSLETIMIPGYFNKAQIGLSKGVGRFRIGDVIHIKGTDDSTLFIINNATGSIVIQYYMNYIIQGGFDYIEAVGINDYTGHITEGPSISIYSTGLAIRLRINEANTTACTLNISELGVRPLTDELGNDFVTRDLIANKIYNFVYSLENKWIMFGSRPASVLDAGTVKLASTDDVRVGTNVTRAVTPASLQGNFKYATNGYKEFPGGLVMNWGESSIPAFGNQFIYFQQESAGTYTVQLTSLGAEYSVLLTVTSGDGQHFVLKNGSDFTATFSWLAIGGPAGPA